MDLFSKQIFHKNVLTNKQYHEFYWHSVESDAQLCFFLSLRSLSERRNVNVHNLRLWIKPNSWSVIFISRCTMSSAAEDEDAAALETVNSVTLTQDSDGSIILHCPPNGGLTHTLKHTFLSFLLPNLSFLHSCCCHRHFPCKRGLFHLLNQHKCVLTICVCVCRWGLWAPSEETASLRWRTGRRWNAAVLCGHFTK